MLFFLVYILFVIICPSTVANVLIYFSQVLMLPSYRTILVYELARKDSHRAYCVKNPKFNSEIQRDDFSKMFKTSF